MSPTVFRQEGFRFFFFSREEERMHIHVIAADGEAKFWLEPQIALAKNFGFSDKDLKKLLSIIEEQSHVIKSSWQQHFGH